MPAWFASPAHRSRFILVIALVAVVTGILLAAWAALVPFFLGAMLAYLLMPAVNFLDYHAPRPMRNRGWSRPVAIIITYVAVLALVAGVLAYFVPVISGQFEVLVKAFPGYIERIDRLFTVDVQALIERIPPEIQDAVNSNISKAIDTLVSALQKGVSATLRTVSQTVSFIIGLVIVPFWLFYVLRDSSKMQQTFYGMIPEKAQDDVRNVMKIIDDLLSAYIRGQLLLCLLVGVMATAALVILGVNFALLLGTLAGIFEVIPILGPYLGAIPAILMALVDRPRAALWVAISFAAIQQIENIFLVPRISGNAVRFHPALVMVIVVVGSQVAGLWGLLVAVPIAAIVRDVYHYLYLRTTERGATPNKAFEMFRARSA